MCDCFFLLIFFSLFSYMSNVGQLTLDHSLKVPSEVIANRFFSELVCSQVFIPFAYELTILRTLNVHFDSEISSSDCVHIIVLLIKLTCFLHVVDKSTKAKSNEGDAWGCQSNLVVLVLEFITLDIASMLSEECRHLFNTVLIGVILAKAHTFLHPTICCSWHLSLVINNFVVKLELSSTSGSSLAIFVEPCQHLFSTKLLLTACFQIPKLLLLDACLVLWIVRLCLFTIHGLFTFWINTKVFEIFHSSIWTLELINSHCHNWVLALNCVITKVSNSWPSILWGMSAWQSISWIIGQDNWESNNGEESKHPSKLLNGASVSNKTETICLEWITKVLNVFFQFFLSLSFTFLYGVQSLILIRKSFSAAIRIKLVKSCPPQTRTTDK